MRAQRVLVAGIEGSNLDPFVGEQAKHPRRDSSVRAHPKAHDRHLHDVLVVGVEQERDHNPIHADRRLDVIALEAEG